MSYMVNDRLFWPGGKKKCLTLSYDDGVTQDIRFLEILNKAGVKATFNLNPGLFGVEGKVAAGKKEVPHIKIAKDKIAETYKGHEIAAHGQLHTSMFGMDPARCTYEILKSRNEIEKLLKKPVTGFAYAFGACDETIVAATKASGLRYARTVVSTHRFDIPQNFLLWDATCHHNDEKLPELTEEFLSDDPYFSFYSPAKLFYVWGHAYEFDQDDNWDMFEKFIEKVSGRGDVWYATNGEIEEYVRAYRNLIFSVESDYVTNPSSIPVWIGGVFNKDILCIGPGETKELPPKQNV